MKNEMYSNIIGKKVWKTCSDKPIWLNNYYAVIKAIDNSLYDRIEIQYDSRLEAGEIKYVDVIKYNGIDEDRMFLRDLSIDEQKKIFDHLMSELPKIK